MATKATSTKKKAPAKKVVASKTTVTSAPAKARRLTLSKRVESSMLNRNLWRALAAEFIGTFLLASVIIAGQGQPIFVLFGLAGIVLLIGSVSGAHVNPAVTIGAWATRRIGWLRAVSYIVVQFLGAAAAFFALSAFLGGAAQPTAEQQLYGQTAATLFSAIDITTLTGKEWFVFFAEVLGTAILGFAVANALRLKDSLSSAFSVGLGIFIALMVTVTVGGFVSASTILNPAVALSLQAYSPALWPYAAYALGPIIGAIIGFVLFDIVKGKQQA